MAAPWTGARPDVLKIIDSAWRSQGDTVERLEMLAQPAGGRRGAGAE